MNQKPRLLLFDANVVFHLIEHGLWERVLGRVEVILTATVVDECKWIRTGDGAAEPIDLTADIDAGRVTFAEVEVSVVQRFLDRFDPVYLEKLDPGESESLVYLCESNDGCLICTADKIVFSVRGQLDLAERGISLEELLGRVGLGRDVPRHFGKDYREQWTKKGWEERLHGIGVQSDPRD